LPGEIERKSSHRLRLKASRHRGREAIIEKAFALADIDVEGLTVLEAGTGEVANWSSSNIPPSIR
jgi:hypothetical protein